VVTGGGLASGDCHCYQDDRSRPVPGHASPRQAEDSGYAYTPTNIYAPCAEQFPHTTMPGFKTSMNQCNIPHTRVPNSDTSSHNGIQGRFGPGVKGGLPSPDAGHSLGTGNGRGTGGVLAGHVHVAHVPGQAPETFYAQHDAVAMVQPGGPTPGRRTESRLSFTWGCRCKLQSAFRRLHCFIHA
jgi:hypothetical protein